MLIMALPLYICAARVKAIAANANIAEITGGHVYRVVKGSFLNIKEAKSANFGLRILDIK